MGWHEGVERVAVVDAAVDLECATLKGGARVFAWALVGEAQTCSTLGSVGVHWRGWLDAQVMCVEMVC